MFIQRAMIMNRSDVLEIDSDLLPKQDSPSLDVSTEPGAPPSTNADDDLNTLQPDHIVNVLREAHGVIEGAGGAAVRLGLKPGTLRHRMQKIGHRPRRQVKFAISAALSSQFIFRFGTRYFAVHFAVIIDPSYPRDAR